MSRCGMCTSGGAKVRFQFDGPPTGGLRFKPGTQSLEPAPVGDAWLCDHCWKNVLGAFGGEAVKWR